MKQAADESVEKYKARFVARGFSQIEGFDYEETFAPVARYSSIRTILALSVQMGWHIHQMDVMTAFLNGVIEEEVYIEQPEGFDIFSSELHVCVGVPCFDSLANQKTRQHQNCWQYDAECCP